MPAAIIAVASAVAGYGIATSIVIVNAITAAGALAAGAIVATAIGYIGNQLLAPDVETYHLDFQRGHLMNKASTTAPIPIIYGSRRVGGARVFMEVSGDSNEYLHLVYAFCEGPIGAINAVYLNDVASTDTKFSGYVTINKHLGDENQAADADLIAACPSSSVREKLSTNGTINSSSRGSTLSNNSGGTSHSANSSPFRFSKSDTIANLLP